MKEIKILGTGCPKCQKLAAEAEAAARSAGVDVTITKVTDINEILSFNVMATPALVINGQVKSAGRIPTLQELRDWLLEP